MEAQDTNNDLVALWEQMGASTGSFLGKLIGLSAQYTLEAYNQIVIDPLKQSQANTDPPPSDTGVPSDIRTRTWHEMSKEFGESWGTSVGLAMDVFINSLKTAAESSVPGFKQNTRQDSEKT